MRNRKPSVLMVTYQYAPTMDGGAERQAQRLAEELAARGRRVGVVTPRFPGLARHESLGGVELHRVSVAPESGRTSITFLPTLAAFLLFGGWRFDIWHAHQAYYHAGLALSLARLLGKRCVVKAAASGPYGDLARLQRSPMGGYVQRTLLKADAVISLNSELTEELVTVGIDPARVRHIPNGVDCAQFSPPSHQERREARAGLGIPSHGVVVLFAGRLAEDKGVDYLLDGWRSIEQRFPGECWTLVLAGAERGSNKYRVRGERELHGVKFLGKVADMRPLLSAADVLIHPSLTEGLSNIVLEAMATALPVVGTAIAGLRELIDDGVSGLLVAPRDADALVRALIVLLRDPELRGKMGAAARVRAEQRYSLASMVDAYEDLYDRLVPDLLGSRPSAPR